MRNYNSDTNQEIKGKFVMSHVLTCFSYEMEAILRAEQDRKTKYPLPTYEDIENAFTNVCEDCGEDQADNEEECSCGGNFEGRPKEIFEWWIVSKDLYKKLKSKGQAVLEWGNNYYWGRCTTGQAILLDPTISEICEEMEILEGQKYDWSK